MARASRLWWLPAALLGLLAAGGAWALDALVADAPDGPEDPDVAALRFPFLRGPAVDPACVPACLPDVLVVRGGLTTAAQVAAAEPGAAGVLLPAEGDVQWLTEDVGVLRARMDACPAGAEPSSAPCGRAGPHVARAAAPADRVSALVTVLVVLDDGRVQASNANRTELEPFERAGDFVSLPYLPYALEPGAAGMPYPPLLDTFAPGLRDALRTLPDGATVTRVVESHPFADVLGTLYVTARVDPYVPARPALDAQQM